MECLRPCLGASVVLGTCRLGYSQWCTPWPWHDCGAAKREAPWAHRALGKTLVIFGDYSWKRNMNRQRIDESWILVDLPFCAWCVWFARFHRCKDSWLTTLRWSAIIGWTSFRTFVIAVRRPSLWCILWRWHRTSTGIRLWCGQADAQEGSGVSRYKKLLKHLKRIQKALEHKCHHKSTQLGTKTFEFVCFFQAHCSFFALQPCWGKARATDAWLSSLFPLFPLKLWF